jgi:hypothetical protein
MKMKFVSIFASLCLVSNLALAVSYTVTEDPTWQPPPDASPEVARQALLRDLRRKAVVDWLRKNLGEQLGEERINALEAQVTPEIVESNISSYRVNRTANNKTELTVDLNVGALRGWVNLVDSKSRQEMSLRPAVIVGSQLVGFLISPEETSSRAQDNPFVQTMVQMTHSSLAKMQVSSAPPRGSFYGSKRPKTASEIRSLSNQSAMSGFNSAIWVQLVSCRECGGARLDLTLFNFNKNRSELSITQDITADANLFGNPERLKNTVKPAFQELQTKAEALLSSGLLFDATYQLSITSIPAVTSAKDMRNYRIYRQIEDAISQLDSIDQAKIKGIEPATLRLEIQTSKSTTDLAQMLEAAQLPGFRLQRDRVDSTSLVMRYLK